MTTRITTLIENSQGEHLSLHTEHGLSFFIEQGTLKIIFDMGQSGAFLENAAKMGIDPSAADIAAISHGHYDHGGGWRALIDAGFKGTLFTGKGVFDKKYATDGVSLEYLGLDFDERFLGASGIPHRIAQGGLEKIADGVFMLSAFPRIHAQEAANPRFLVERNGKLEIDDFSDEIALAVDSPKGFILLLGCSHPGVMNIIDAARASLPRPVYAVMGGTHLVEASPERLDLTVRFIKELNLEIIGVSHCTGAHGVAELAKTGNRFFRNTTGHSLWIVESHG